MTLREQFIEQVNNLQFLLWNAGQHALYLFILVLGMIIFGIPLAIVYFRQRKKKTLPEA